MIVDVAKGVNCNTDSISLSPQTDLGVTDIIPHSFQKAHTFFRCKPDEK